MNTVNLNDKRDFPLSTNALKFMQDAYAQLEQLAKLGGDNFILSGCTVTGISASAGWVVIGGKLMPFLSNTIQTTVRVVSDTQIKTVGSGTREETTVWAEFGTSANPAENIPWATLDANRIANKRLVTLDEATKLIDLDTKAQLDAKFATSEVAMSVMTGYTLPDASYYLTLLVNNKTVTVFGKVRAGNPANLYFTTIPEAYRPKRIVNLELLRSGLTTVPGYVSNSTGRIIATSFIYNDDLTFSATWLIE